MEITIFTPTYNRAYIIKNLYESLKKQTFKDFEWIVIDDGSTDNTEELFSEIMNEENSFPIIYKKVENGGKHRAINKGVLLATGRMFFIVDSDDNLPEDSLETILKYEKTIDECHRSEFAGVSGLKGYSCEQSLGGSFNGDFLDMTYLETQKNGVYGDKAEVYYTDVLKKYPFPEFEGELFILESVVWNEIGASGLKLRYFNKVVYYCEYLEDGLTNLGMKKFENTPKGYGLYLYQSIKYGKLKKLKKWESIFAYYRMYREKNTFLEISRNLKMNPVKLYFRLLGLRLFYKLYNR